MRRSHDWEQVTGTMILDCEKSVTSFSQRKVFGSFWLSCKAVPTRRVDEGRVRLRGDE